MGRTVGHDPAETPASETGSVACGADAPEAHPGSGPAGGLLLLSMAFTRITFLLVCLGVRAELEPGEATEELVMPALLRSAAAVVLVALQRSRSATRRSGKSPRASWWWRTRSRHACSSAAGKFGTGATCEWQPGRRQASAHRGARHPPIPAFIGARPRAARAAAPVVASSPPARLRVRAHG